MQSASTAISNKSGLAKQLERVDATDSAKKIRENIAQGNATAIADLQKVFNALCRAERPEPATMVPSSDREAIRKRIAFMQEHAYPMDAISEQYIALGKAKEA